MPHGMRVFCYKNYDMLIERIVTFLIVIQIRFV